VNEIKGEVSMTEADFCSGVINQSNFSGNSLSHALNSLSSLSNSKESGRT